MRLIDADALADEIAAIHPMDIGGSAMQAAVMAKIAAAPTVELSGQTVITVTQTGTSCRYIQNSGTLNIDMRCANDRHQQDQGGLLR